MYNVRMDSDLEKSDRSAKQLRRTPQQERGEQRKASMLNAAGQLFARLGYEVTTMTAIAEKSASSIGALYQYFPDKETIALALRTQYSDEMDDRWTALIEIAAGLSIAELGEKIIDLMVGFLQEHPAYFNLLSAPLAYRRSDQARLRLRKRFAAVIREKQASLSNADSLRLANVALEIVKSLNPLYAVASKPERLQLVREYKLVLVSYLQIRLTQ